MSIFSNSELPNGESQRVVTLAMSAFEYRRLVEWMKDRNRKPANTAFTSGAARDAARAFEEAMR